MTPVDQEFMHEPSNGSYGDCQRACIASLLDLPREQVPHFLHDDCNYDTFKKRIKEFLALHGLMEVVMPLEDCPYLPQTCHHMMYGYTVRGTYHAVVARNGAVVHDPHPSKAGIILDDRAQYAFLFHTGGVVPVVAA